MNPRIRRALGMRPTTYLERLAFERAAREAALARRERADNRRARLGFLCLRLRAAARRWLPGFTAGAAAVGVAAAIFTMQLLDERDRLRAERDELADRLIDAALERVTLRLHGSPEDVRRLAGEFAKTKTKEQK